MRQGLQIENDSIPAFVFTFFVRSSHRKREFAVTQSTGATKSPAQSRLQIRREHYDDVH